MKEAYKELIKMEDYYKDMKKKYPYTSRIWDELIKVIDGYKRDLLSGKKNAT